MSRPVLHPGGLVEVPVVGAVLILTFDEYARALRRGRSVKINRCIVQDGQRGALFRPTHKFKRDYDRLFRKDPAAANLFLLLAELSDERGRVQVADEELAFLMAARFDDPRAYQLQREVTT